MTHSYATPRVGVALILEKEGKLLLGKRKGTDGAGSWGFAGGHLEKGESCEQCAHRELYEETGLKLLSLRKGTWFNEIRNEIHYITVFFHVEQFEGELRLMEPDKCEMWQWFAWNALPEPLFSPTRTFIESNQTKS